MAGQAEDPHDLESGPGDAEHPTGAGQSGQADRQTPHGARNSLIAFQKLVGIRTDKAVRFPGNPAYVDGSDESRPLLPKNRAGGSDDNDDFHRPEASWVRVFITGPDNDTPGLYQRAIDEELRSRIWFRLSALALNWLYILQVVVAASFTGLSSAQGHRSTLTFLGVVNTVIAGFLALMKGQGLPNRFLKDRDHFRSLIAAIEDRELFYSEFERTPDASDPVGLRLVEEVQSLEDRYSTALQDQQDNYPEIYVSNQDRALWQAQLQEIRESVPRTPAERQQRIATLQNMLAKELSQQARPQNASGQNASGQQAGGQ